MTASYLLDGVRSRDELMVMVVDERVPFTVEEPDLRVEVVLGLDELRKGRGLDEVDVKGVGVERGRVYEAGEGGGGREGRVSSGRRRRASLPLF